ncbi:MAG: phage tail tape measure protein [Bacilli bacterium]
MALNVGALIATLGLNKKGFDDGVKDASKKTEGFAAGFGEKLSKLKVPIAAVGAAVAAMGTAAVLAADNINKAYAGIRVGSGATGEALEILKSDFDAVFGTVPADAAEVSTAIADLNTRLGLTGPALQDMATQFLELSRITGTDVASNIKDVTRLFGSWDVAADDQAGTLDNLFKTSQSTGIEVGKLATLSTQYGSTLQGLGFDLKDSVAMLGKFEKEGVNVEAALAGMKMGLGKLASEGITDPIEAWDELTRRVKGAETEMEAVGVASEVFGARAAAEMASAIRSGNMDLGDFVAGLDASEETVLGAADDAMTLGDRMGILQHKAEKALQPVGNLMIGVFETAMPHLEAAGDALVEAGESVATWAEEAVAAAGPVVDALQEKMTPAVEFFQGRMDHVVTWWDENSKIFIAAWENIAAAISWVIETVVVPLFEWAWPYIEDIYSGVLDTMLGVAKLFASILAGDWEAAGDALVDISKGAMSAFVGVASMGWDAVATGIEFVGQGIADFVYAMWANIVQATEDAINSMIDRINGFLKAINSVTEKVGISMPTLSHISLKADKIEAPKIEIPRWSETTAGKAFDELLSSSKEEEEDIDAEFEDADAPEQAPELPKSSLPVVPKPEIPATVPTTVKVPPVDVPDSDVQLPPTPTLPDTQPPAVTAPTIETPVPVTVVNWPDHMPAVPAPEIPVVDEDESEQSGEDDIDEEFAGIPEQAVIWPAFPECHLPTMALPDFSPLAPAPAPDVGYLARALDRFNIGGETRVVVELDGNVIGETLFRTWNRRTGGALNG